MYKYHKIVIPGDSVYILYDYKLIISSTSFMLVPRSGVLWLPIIMVNNCGFSFVVGWSIDVNWLTAKDLVP